jgi:hypothetical protein
MARNKGGRQLTTQQAVTFDTAEQKLTTFHSDVEKLSNKKPDGLLNTFKLGFINQILASVNELLGDEYRPFPDFTIFDVEGSMPSASDVVMMLSQYRKAMQKFRRDHQITVTKPTEGFEELGVEEAVAVWNLSDKSPDPHQADMSHTIDEP